MICPGHIARQWQSRDWSPGQSELCLGAMMRLPIGSDREVSPSRAASEGGRVCCQGKICSLKAKTSRNEAWVRPGPGQTGLSLLSVASTWGVYPVGAAEGKSETGILGRGHAALPVSPGGSGSPQAWLLGPEQRLRIVAKVQKRQDTWACHGLALFKSTQFRPPRPPSENTQRHFPGWCKHASRRLLPSAPAFFKQAQRFFPLGTNYGMFAQKCKQ